MGLPYSLGCSGGGNEMLDNIIFYAFRYALGRQTYAPVIVRDCILENIKLFTIADLKQIIREIDDADQLGNLGDPKIDKTMWISFKNDLQKYITDSESDHAYDIEGFQLASVKKDGSAIQYITAPSLAVQLAAVKQYCRSIKYIKDPSLEVQLEAVKQDGCVIKYIKDPHPEVQLAAVKEYGCLIYYIEDPSLEVQVAAVTQNGRALKYIKDPCEEVKLAAVKGRQSKRYVL